MSRLAQVHTYIINYQLSESDFKAALGKIPNFEKPPIIASLNAEALSVAHLVLNGVQRFSLNDYCQKYKFDYLTTNKPISVPQLVVFDMDSTLIPIEVIDELANFADAKEAVSEVTELAMQGKLDFNQSLIQRVSFLKGLPAGVIEELAGKIEFNPGVEKFCQFLVTRGSKLAIASGGFVPFAQALQTRIPFDYIRANELEIDNGHLTGKVINTIINADEKAIALQNWAKELDLSLEQCMAVGDGANDLKMLATAGSGVAYHAKPLVNEQATSVLKYGEMGVLTELYKSFC